MEENTIISIIGISVSLLIIMAVTLVGFFHYTRKKIIEKETEKVNIKLNHQKKLLQTTIKVQEAERNRIAQDLHDAISSKLNVVSLTTHILLDDTSINTKQKEALNHILDITTKTLESARKLAHELMPPILDKFGLKVALEELFEEFTSNTALQINYNIDTINDLSKPNELHIFRIAQELINNSLVHGKANELQMKLVKADDGFKMIYNDNGRGFNVDKTKRKPGIGLQNIKSRVAILNGHFYMESSENKGSTFIINCCNYGI